MNTLEIFSTRLRELRLNKQLSQKALAINVGVSHYSIAQWENRVRLPKAASLVKLVKFFNVRANYLLGLENI